MAFASPTLFNRLGIILSLFILLISPLKAGFLPIIFEYYSVKDGLRNSRINSIVQDRRGFMWFGTEDGLYRFDGQNFITYGRSGTGESDGLSNGMINHVSLAVDDHIWVSTEMGGHNRLDVAKDQVSKFDFSRFSNYGLYFDRGNQCFPGPDKKMYLLTRAGLLRVERDDSLTFLYRSRLLGNSIPTCGVFDQSGFLWLGTYHGLKILDLFGNEGEKPIHESWIKRNKDFVSAIYLDSRQNIIVATRRPGLYRFRPGQEAPDSFQIDVNSEMLWKSRINSICEDPAGNLWFGTREQGLYRIRKNSLQAERYKPDPNILDSQLNPEILSLFTDAQGTIWIGTNAGLYKFSPDYQPFNFIPVFEKNRGLLKGGAFTTLYQSDKKRLFFASSLSGFFELDSDNSTRQIIPKNSPGLKINPNLMVRRDSHSLWLASPDGFYTFNFRNDQISKVSAVEPSFFKRIFDLQEDTKGRIWLAMPLPELICYDPATEKLAAFKYEGGGDAASGCRFTSLALGKGNKLWVGTAACGLLVFDLEKMSFDQDFNQKNKENRQSVHRSIGHLMVYGDSLYFATHSHGIGVMDLNTRQIITLGTKQGLSSNQVKGFIKRKEFLWVFTPNGISRLNLKTMVFTTFDHRHGLIQANFSSQPLYDPENGAVIASTEDYLLKFYLDSLYTPKPPPDPQLLEVSLFGKALHLDSLRRSGQILKVPYNRNYFSIRFASLDYRQSNTISYQLKLAGLDNDWITNESDRSARFRNLPGGTYDLLARSKVEGGKWGKSTILLQIEVGVAFWKTWWFILGIIACIFAIVYALYRNRIAHLIEIMSIRNKISRDLHDEIGSSLSSISILSQLLISRQGSLPKEDQALLNKIHSHTLRTMDSMDDIIWTINPGNDNGDKMRIRICQMATETLDSLDIAWQIDWADELNRRQFFANERWNCLMIVKEALNNIAKHSKATKVEIEGKKVGSKLQLIIRDNGKGFIVPENSSRNGLRNMEERAGILGGTLKIKTEPETGTLIILQWPE